MERIKKIRTLRGDIPKDALGWSQCHEHLFIADGPSRKVNAALYMDDFDKSSEECMTYKQVGGGAFVDCQPGGFGRKASSLVKLSEQVDINIVSVTGYHKLIFAEELDLWINSAEEELTRRFIGEMENGIIDNEISTNAKAGAIKCVLDSDDKFNKTYQKLFHAVCDAAQQTKAPIVVHLDSGTDAIGLISAFEKRGIKSTSVLLCHLDRARYDFGYHRETASTGAFLVYDTINRLKYHSNEDEIKLIQHMIENGFLNHLLLAMDTTNQRLKAYGASFGLDYILKDFRQMMIENGINETTINRMMINNAQNALAF